MEGLRKPIAPWPVVPSHGALLWPRIILQELPRFFAHFFLIARVPSWRISLRQHGLDASFPLIVFSVIRRSRGNMSLPRP